jgi:hypothetical protein
MIQKMLRYMLPGTTSEEIHNKMHKVGNYYLHPTENNKNLL